MIRQFLKDEEGQTTVEYVMIIAVIVLVVTVAGNRIQPLLKDVIDTVFKGVTARVSELMKQ